jgi:hypothetical protein
MATVPVERPCPLCGRPSPIAAVRCPSCGGQIAAKQQDVEVVDFLVPRKVSGWSLAACYFGLIGLLLPVLGLFFAAPAVIFGVVALMRKRQGVSYGSVTSDIRAILGLIFGGLGTLIWGAVWLMILAR